MRIKALILILEQILPRATHTHTPSRRRTPQILPSRPYKPAEIRVLPHPAWLAILPIGRLFFEA